MIKEGNKYLDIFIRRSNDCSCLHSILYLQATDDFQASKIPIGVELLLAKLLSIANKKSNFTVI